MRIITLAIITLSIFLSENVAFSQNNNDLGAPKNGPLTIENQKTGLLLKYDNTVILSAESTQEMDVISEVNMHHTITQNIEIRLSAISTLHFEIFGSSEAIPLETRGKAQKEFPMIRTSHGLSHNLRNNAIYDRKYDWLMIFPEGVKIVPKKNNIDGSTKFSIRLEGKATSIIFQPRYYQKHKNVTHFRPWTYKIKKESITGWCSWWAFFRDFTEQDNEKLLQTFENKNMADYGYKFIQIDDGFQGGKDRGRTFSKLAHNYLGGRPTTWLDWREDNFPGGLTEYVKQVKQYGFSPSIWIGCFFSDEQVVNKNPEWFVTGKNKKPFAAPWVSYTIDATNTEAVEALIRPTFKGLKNAGIEYVKIDQLRHYLYDCLHNNIEWCKNHGVKPDEVIRSYLRIAREELGNETFILSCWGVLPEAVGLADACRIGGDGYGPVTLQQYNSWNGIVWRNDPDHCDVLPSKKSKEIGNVKKTEVIQALRRESIIRPVLASIAGAMLMLSDKPEVYQNDENLAGAKRSSPVLFSVPGQIYDYDPTKTDWLKNNKRTDIKSGKNPSPIEGDQFGEVCPFWLNEYNIENRRWMVLHRLNWVKNKQEYLKASVIKLKDIGVDPDKEYLVFEFWSSKFLGVIKKEITLKKLKPYGLESFAIREKLNRPQIISTNRHISQGAAEIEMLRWKNNTLTGRSRVVVDDEYIISVFVPKGFKFKNAMIKGQTARVKHSGNLLQIIYLPQKTESLDWKISFY